MLKLILTFAIAGFFMQAQAQNLRPIDIPFAVTAAFHQAYPSISAFAWNKVGNNFEAEYKVDTLNRSVTYTSSGILFETNREILEAALPDPVMKYMNENYKDNKVNVTSEITDANGIVTYKTKTKEMELFFDSKGNFVKLANN